MTTDDYREVVDEPRNPDPFILAAHVSAQQYTGPRMHVGTATDREIAAHVDGWAAARDHLAAQEPTDAEVLAALNAYEWVFWRDEPESDLSAFIGDRVPAMRAALTAARAVGRDAR